jgi:K+-transporting ATPase ATPase C chain
MTLAANALFPRKASGSVLTKGGIVIGSELIAQNFRSDRYFWPRPSAIDYSPLPSGGSNYGPTSRALKNMAEKQRTLFLHANGLADSIRVPADMVFSSASGLDPDISPQAALLQVERIVRAREFDGERRRKLIELVQECVEERQFGLLGQPRVNVLLLNRALDAMHE